MASSPSHRLVGAALGYHVEVIEVILHCTECKASQIEPLEADASAKSACEGITCLFCGRTKTMRIGLDR